jgi:hypothetical protein
MNMFNFFKVKKLKPTVAGLQRVDEFDESSNDHTQTPDSCKRFGYQVGYNKALDFYEQHGMIPEPNKSVVALTHWKKFIEFGKVEGHNKAVADLIQKELTL